MQMKRRFSGILLIFCSLLILTFLFQLDVTKVTVLLRGKLPFQNVDSHQQGILVNNQFTAREHIETLASFKKNLANLADEVEILRRSFVENTLDLAKIVKKKDIYIDILNHGDLKRCHNVSLLIMISSHISHFDRRHTIRSTWANESYWKKYLNAIDFSVGLLFLVGKDEENKTLNDQLYKESKIHGDLLIEHLHESFYSLSYKIMIGFQYIDDQCSFDYLLKGDDDIFVNIYNMVNFLRASYIPKKRLYVGHMMTISEVLRNGRYGVSREEYIRDFYPRYCSGGGFIISRDVVSGMIPHFNWLNPLKIDDAYMGHLILKAGVNAWHDKRFRMYENNCTLYDDTLIMHSWKNQAVHPMCATTLNKQAYLDALKEIKMN